MGVLENIHFRSPTGHTHIRIHWTILYRSEKLRTLISGKEESLAALKNIFWLVYPENLFTLLYLIRITMYKTDDVILLYNIKVLLHKQFFVISLKLKKPSFSNGKILPKVHYILSSNT